MGSPRNMEAGVDPESNEAWLMNSVRVKKFSFLLLLLITCLNIISTLSSTKQIVHKPNAKHPASWQIWFSETSSIVQLLLAVAALLYLTGKMNFLKAKSKAASINILGDGSLTISEDADGDDDASDSQKSPVLHPTLLSIGSDGSEERTQVENPSFLPCMQPIPQKRDQYPSDFLILTSSLFAIPSCLSTIIEASCLILDPKGVGVWSKTMIWYECLRLILLTSFVACQSGFFIFYGRRCVNSDIRSIVIAMSIVLSANISSWFFTVGHEISYIIHNNSNPDNHSSYCATVNSKVVKSLYPLLIEYFVMNALFALSFISNTGCREALQQSAAQLRSVMQKLIEDRHCCELRFPACHHGWGASVSIIMIIFSLVLYLAQTVYENFDKVMDYILLVTHSLAVIMIIFIIVYSKYRVSTREDLRIFHLHSMETIPLWIANCAVLIYDFYQISYHIENLSHKVPDVLSSVMNSMQCTLQSAFLTGFVSIKINSIIDLMLFLLMLTNAVEWCIYTAYFANLFPDNWHEGFVIAVITSPLLVFFRFHCIGCFDQVRVPSQLEEKIRDLGSRATMLIMMRMSEMQAPGAAD